MTTFLSITFLLANCLSAWSASVLLRGDIAVGAVDNAASDIDEASCATSDIDEASCDGTVLDACDGTILDAASCDGTVLDAVAAFSIAIWLLPGTDGICCLCCLCCLCCFCCPDCCSVSPCSLAAVGSM
jgi:hypothetical protein